VCLTGRDRERLAAAQEEAARDGGRAETFPADLESDAQIRALAQWIEHRIGGPDILVHGAGVISLGPTEEADVEELDRQYRTNLRAPYLLTQLLLPSLRKRHGQVVFINSTAGLSAGAGSGAYAATKHGLTAIADSLRDEVNEDGIRVVSLFLGRTATPMQRVIHEFEGRPYEPERLIQPEEVADLVVRVLQLPRTVEVTEIRMRPAAKPQPRSTL